MSERVCNYCGGSGVEPKPDWMKAQKQRLLELNNPFRQLALGENVADDKVPCFGCHGRKMVPNCPHCEKGPLMVKCGSCSKEFELVPWCMNRLLPLAGAHIRYGPGSQYIIRMVDGVKQYLDFCSPECKAVYSAGSSSSSGCAG